ncbi:MAG: type II toxin-antitoxin system RelE/ParE family toxin [bacterium]
MSFIFHPAAEHELHEAAAYYDDKSPGLGRELILELFRAVDFVCENPEGAPRVSDGERRKLVAQVMCRQSSLAA